MAHQIDWNDLNIILAIARTGSLSGAARNLKLNHSTVFRQINAIEKKLGVRFFDRLPSGYVLTQAGEAAMHSAERIDNEVLDLTRELVGMDFRLQGTIRVTAPEGISMVLLGPLLADFVRQHPDIHIDLIVTSSSLQLSRREADIAVRVTHKPPDTTIARRVCRFSFAMYASRSYLAQNKKAGEIQHAWLLPDDSRDWFPTSVWKKLGQTNISPAFSSNSTMAILSACKSGIGVAPLPCFLGDVEKTLVRVVEPDEKMALELWVLMHPDLRQTTRVRTLMQFLHAGLAKQSSVIEGQLV